MGKFFRKNERFIVILLLTVFFLQSIAAIGATSPTYDESHHSTSSHYYLASGNYTFDVEHPPLKTIAALPFLFYGFSTPKCFLCIDVYGDKYDDALFFSRIIILVFSLILGFFVYLWTKKLFGVEGGILALFFYSFEPNIIAHSSLFTTDLLAACFIFISTYYFWIFLNNATWRNAFLFGFVFGLAAIAKFSSLLLIPSYAALLLVFLVSKRVNIFNKQLPAKFFAILFIALLVINSAYLFVGTFRKLGEYNISLTNSIKNEYTSWIPIPLPKYYIEGLEVARWHSEGGHFGWYAFLMGEHKIEGWWYYFIVAFLIKTPIPLILLFSLFLFLFILQSYKNPSYYFLLVPVAIFFFVMSFLNHVNIGLRYILPIYPFIFVAIGSLYGFFVKNRIRMDVLTLLLAFYIISSLSIFPYHLAYFNELVGGPKNGYKYLIDSNLEWGQNDRLVDEYVRTTGAIKNPGCTSRKGLVVVSANELWGTFDMAGINCYKWLRDNYEPVDYVGYSWLVYNITG